VQWYIAENGNQKKIPEEVLKYKIENGEISPDTLIINSEVNEWTPLKNTDIWKMYANDSGVDLSSLSQTKKHQSNQSAGYSNHVQPQKSSVTQSTIPRSIGKKSPLPMIIGSVVTALALAVGVLFGVYGKDLFNGKKLFVTEDSIVGTWYNDDYSGLILAYNFNADGTFEYASNEPGLIKDTASGTYQKVRDGGYELVGMSSYNTEVKGAAQFEDGKLYVMGKLDQYTRLQLYKSDGPIDVFTYYDKSSGTTTTSPKTTPPAQTNPPLPDSGRPRNNRFRGTFETAMEIIRDGNMAMVFGFDYGDPPNDDVTNTLKPGNNGTSTTMKYKYADGSSPDLNLLFSVEYGEFEQYHTFDSAQIVGKFLDFEAKKDHIDRVQNILGEPLYTRDIDWGTDSNMMYVFPVKSSNIMVYVGDNGIITSIVINAN